MTDRSRARRPVLKVEDWPAPDRSAWETAIRQGDPFEDAGPVAHWRQTTRRTVCKDYGRWLGWLAADGLLQDKQAPEARVCPENILRYIAHLQNDCRDTTVLMRIDGLRRMIQAMAPKVDWGWLSRVAGHLKRNIASKKDKRPRIRSSRDLYQLGLWLMDEADGYSTVDWKRATRYRDGLIIGLLAARPLRIRNLARLECGRHLIETSDGFLLHIPADEVKTGTELEFPVPADLVPYMHHYLKVHRPVLTADPNEIRLWITKYGAPMGEGAIFKQVTKLTREAFGVSVNPHLFRDCLATSMAIDDPEHVLVASKLLGHARSETTSRHYNQATALDAGRKLAHNIQDLRRSSLNEIERRLRP